MKRLTLTLLLAATVAYAAGTSDSQNSKTNAYESGRPTGTLDQSSAQNDANYQGTSKNKRTSKNKQNQNSATDKNRSQNNSNTGSSQQ